MNLLMNQMIKNKMNRKKKMIKKIKMNNKKKILIIIKKKINRKIRNKMILRMKQTNGWIDSN
jgi:hypothetical protein